MKLQWEDRTWEEYEYWLTQDKRTLKRINALIRDIMRSPFEGIGKPEPLKGNLSGLWSRRIDEINRIVYFVRDDIVFIISCKGHYDDQKLAANCIELQKKSSASTDDFFCQTSV